MSLPAASTPPASFKTFLRRALGNHAYRVVTQTPRILNFLVRPHYEPEAEALPQLVKKTDICFDVGANYGHYARLLSPLAKKVYSFEPAYMTFKCVKIAKAVLGWKNVIITQCALADKPGELTLTTPIKSHGGLGIALAHLGTAIDRPGITETVAVKTLDQFMIENDIPSCDFIKCDVEGAEFLMLQGAAKTIHQYKPTLLLEIDASYLRRNNHGLADIENMLKAEGYDFYTWDNGALAKHDGLTDRRNNIMIARK